MPTSPKLGDTNSMEQYKTNTDLPRDKSKNGDQIKNEAKKVKNLEIMNSNRLPD